VCGISGVFHFDVAAPVTREVLDRMNEVQRHRGPDGAGIYVGERIGLANRRLAIIDRAHGQQPMTNADGSLWITYNGEVFNYQELRRGLERRGHRFRTASDTEVVLEAYAADGADCVSHLNGQFAFAIWDAPRARLFLARDRLGILPLHFAEHAGRFLFASEAKGILAHPAMAAAADGESVVQALLCSTLLDGRTVFRGIESLPPGFTLSVTDAGVERRRYWSLSSLALSAEDAREDRAGERFWEILEDSVRLRLMSEVPFGVLLSGGTDSSTIAKLATRLLGRPVRTFTIDYPNPWKGDDRDSWYAGLMARELGSEHRLFSVEPDAYFDTLERLAWHIERPFNKGSATMYLLYQRIREHATVVLCGEGADELMAGYIGSRGLGLDEVVGDGAIRFFPWAPSWRLMLRLLSPDVMSTARGEEYYAAALDTALAEFSSADVLNQALMLYIRYFLLELLEFHDKTGLAFGVEARPPFLDHRLVELLVPLPSALKAENGHGKAFFKRMLAGFLPSAILERRKTHMPIPRDPRSVYRQVDLTRALLLAPEARSAHYLDRRQLADFLDRRREFEGVPLLAVWQITMYLITLELLHRAYRL
jgi:asparagine synthase (glutamine-hydrolysing)